MCSPVLRDYTLLATCDAMPNWCTSPLTFIVPQPPQSHWQAVAYGAGALGALGLAVTAGVKWWNTPDLEGAAAEGAAAEGAAAEVLLLPLLYWHLCCCLHHHSSCCPVAAFAYAHLLPVAAFASARLLP